MVPRTSYPPVHHHPRLTKPLNPSGAQALLSTFLAKTSTQPHLHPDSQLSTTGITYSAHSGPSGGLAIHHLNRIEAGLRGENLGVETEEDLAQFKEGDDERLDESIARTERKEGKKRKRVEEIQGWAEDTSSQAGAEVDESEWQDQEEYEHQQKPLVGEVGVREGAPLARQNLRGVPGLVEHDERGREVGRGGGGDGDGAKTEQEKKARKAAKKARRRDEGRGTG